MSLFMLEGLLTLPDSVRASLAFDRDSLVSVISIEQHGPGVVVRYDRVADHASVPRKVEPRVAFVGLDPDGWRVKWSMIAG